MDKLTFDQPAPCVADDPEFAKRSKQVVELEAALAEMRAQHAVVLHRVVNASAPPNLTGFDAADALLQQKPAFDYRERLEEDRKTELELRRKIPQFERVISVIKPELEQFRVAARARVLRGYYAERVRELRAEFSAAITPLCAVFAKEDALRSELLAGGFGSNDYSFASLGGLMDPATLRLALDVCVENLATGERMSGLG